MVYNLITPIGFKVFNFNKFINNVNVKAFLNDSSTLPCDCAGSSFVDKDHKPNITAGLEITDDDNLRKLFS